MENGTETNATVLVEPAVDLAAQWVARSAHGGTRDERATAKQLDQIVGDPEAVAFVMAFVDRVVRPDSDTVAAGQLRSLVNAHRLPDFLNPIDKMLLKAGSLVSSVMPSIVMPLARRRMRSIVGHLVAPAEQDKLRAHLEKQQSDGFALNVNLLGEAVLGEREAERRLDELYATLEQPSVDYVSVKVSAIASQLNHFAHDDSLRRVTERLERLFVRAAAARPVTFINLDMEEYHDLELTLAAFMHVLDSPPLRSIDAGIVLQAYLPDSYGALQRLVEWANVRHDRGGGEIKVRLVKGANLAMERVDAALHGWEQAPFDTKTETDANYKRCVDWLLHARRMRGVKLGLASHNLFDIAWTRLLSLERDVASRVQYEMLQGMAPAQAEVMAHDITDTRLLMYTPAVRNENFDVAISYLFRRLEENASDDNFMKHLFRLASDPQVFTKQADIFRDSMAAIGALSDQPRRHQDRGASNPAAAFIAGDPFRNEPDTDPVVATNHAWIDAVVAATPSEPRAPILNATHEIDGVIARARVAGQRHATSQLAARQAMLHRVGDELALRRGEFITTMMHEANKTFSEADGEVSEAIDFARYYAERTADLGQLAGADFAAYGTVAVVPPWNFPVAIPAGGVMAAFAAGNSVILKPAPETPRCAELVAEACWAAGVHEDVIQFVRTPDDHVGRRLIESVDAVILTGSGDTADVFRSWKPALRLFAETSGKNALIISPNADIDLAVADLVRSAFTHGGQKCSAASLAIVIGDTYESERFRRQLVDAVESLSVGSATAIETDMAPLISEPNERLDRGLTELDEAESWLVEPRRLNGVANLWTPGVRFGVRPGSWFHQTECFGPVLGIIHAHDLDEAIEIQNASEYGLTGGIHTLDPDEITHWLSRVEVGNAYVNRPITGAIVQRQPFGGWKRSSVGPGAKAGGPNYVAQLGVWTSVDGDAADDYQAQWDEHFAIEHDPTGLFCEANIFRYVPLERVLLRVEAGATERDIALTHKAAAVAGVQLMESSAQSETQVELAERLASMKPSRVRIVGGLASPELVRALSRRNIHIADGAVTAVGRIELQHYVREQAVSETLHRFGNLTMQRTNT